MQTNWIVKKINQLDQRGNTFWGPIELVEKEYSAVDSSSTDFFAIFKHKCIRQGI